MSMMNRGENLFRATIIFVGMVLGVIVPIDFSLLPAAGDVIASMILYPGILALIFLIGAFGERD